MTREFDVVVFGATGFTGKLVAEYIAQSPDRPRWAIAGRSRDRLEALGLGVPVLVADAHDPAALAAVARRTKVVCTTVGPYAKYGDELVAACAEAGTHYCDLAGEVQWMRRMIDAHHARAVQTGARLVFSCGFDSIPSDIGTWALQQEMVRAFGKPATKVTALFGESSGGISGGTVASGAQTAVEASADRAVRKILGNPYALNPDPYAELPPSPDDQAIGWEPRLKLFTVPFLMAQINTRNVRRGHALAGFPWGPTFVYREVMSTPGGARGALMAATIAGGLAGLAFALKRPRLREMLLKRAPQPGQGPTPDQRARGHWKVRFIGEVDHQHLVFVVADAHGDPGYGSTARMLGESALSLALDPLTSPGGALVASIAMGGHLVERLRRAGLTFDVAS